ncbi:uncharacterized protein [Ptychodera flava]|uniref:uncharacterized protein n=1 Tax=Ptychodera flava TaxID=63121 RepID=UPI00396A22E3
MGPESEITGQALLTAVYSQNWPAPDPSRTPLRGFQGDKRRQNARVGSAKNVRRGGLLSTEERAELMASRPLTPSVSLHSNTLDKDTLKWKSWTSNNDDQSSYTDLSLYKITQDTFRKLTNQVRDVNSMMTNKYRNAGFKKYYVTKDKVSPAVHPSQLASSLRSTRPSYERYPANDVEDIAIQSRPLSRTDRARQVSPRPASSLPRRPHSTMSYYSARSTSPLNEYDSLTPEIAGELGDLNNPTPFYDVPEGPFRTVKSRTWSDSSEEEGDDDDEKTDAEEKTGKDEDDDKHNEPKQGDDEQKEEKEIRHKEFIIPSDLEDFDDDDVDFNESSVEEPEEEYSEPLSKPFCNMDLLYLACLEEDWKEVLETKPEGDEETYMERLVELERLQWVTVNWEYDKLRSGKKSQRHRNGNDRVQSAGPGARPKSRNCVDDCMQPACAGDCPSKRVMSAKGCYHCRKRTCNGSCTEYGYQHFIRSPRTDSDDEIQKRPKSCQSCTRKSTRANTINANNTILGRPKSLYATFSTSELYSTDPKPISAGAIQSANQVIITPRPSTAPSGRSRPSTGKSSRPKGRDSVNIGKSFTSQRKNSITKPVSVNIVTANSRVKSAKKRRPRTAKK